jgi:formylmethanofuran dehydrogenase subunit C
VTRPLTLTQRFVPHQRVDCSPLTPTLLAGKSAREIASLQLQSGNRKLPAGELFTLSGDDPQNLVIECEGDKLERIGARMTGGSVRVQGDCGAYAGLQMRGGEIHVAGSVGAFGACQMRGGLLRIDDDAGEFLGSALPGETLGMAGGTVIVKGNVGDRCGDRMRRGQILIEGHAADYCASRMLAGTIAVMGSVGANLGFAMQRGTVLLRDTPAHILPTFGDCGTHELAFLKLLFQSWTALPSRYAAFAPPPRVQRIVGDLANGGRGEILISARSQP